MNNKNTNLQYPETQADDPGLQPTYHGTQTDFVILPAGYSVVDSTGSPILYQPMSLHPNVPIGLPWIPALPPSADCPPGLEYLNQVNLYLKLLNVKLGFETNKTYDVMNNQGQRIYFAEEKSNCCDVIAMCKALRWNYCWSNCCLQKVIEAPPGEIIGYVYQYYHPYLPMFKIKNENKKDVMKFKGPCVVSSCLRDLNFNLLSLDEELVIGKILNQWATFTRELFTNANKFEVQFPFDPDVKIKALLLRASFLIVSLFLFYFTKE
uniref:Phospholipid scramblase n=1 Tax=Sus scrofa TaxID=9823 RepID=A0A8D0UIC2_PIG